MPRHERLLSAPIPTPPPYERSTSGKTAGDVKWTPALDDWLRAAWATGATTAAIAASAGVSKSTIVGRAHRINIDARPSPILREPRPPGAPPITQKAAPRERSAPRSVPVPVVTLPPLASDTLRFEPLPERDGLGKKPRTSAPISDDLPPREITPPDEPEPALRRVVIPRETVAPRTAAPVGWPARTSARCQMPRGESLRAELCGAETFAGCYCKAHAAIVYRGAAA